MSKTAEDAKRRHDLEQRHIAKPSQEIRVRMDNDRINDGCIRCCDLSRISLTQLYRSIKRQRLRVVVEAVVSDLRLAKADAFEQGARGSSTVEFTVNGGDATNWSYTITDAIDGLLVTRSSSGFSGSIAMAITDFEDSDSDTLPDVTFTADRGLDSGGDGSIQLTIDASTSATINRNLMGLLSVCSNDDLGYPICGS